MKIPSCNPFRACFRANRAIVETDRNPAANPPQSVRQEQIVSPNSPVTTARNVSAERRSESVFGLSASGERASLVPRLELKNVGDNWENDSTSANYDFRVGDSPGVLNPLAPQLSPLAKYWKQVQGKASSSNTQGSAAAASGIAELSKPISRSSARANSRARLGLSDSRLLGAPRTRNGISERGGEAVLGSSKGASKGISESSRSLFGKSPSMDSDSRSRFSGSNVLAASRRPARPFVTGSLSDVSSAIPGPLTDLNRGPGSRVSNSTWWNDAVSHSAFSSEIERDVSVSNSESGSRFSGSRLDYMSAVAVLEADSDQSSTASFVNSLAAHSLDSAAASDFPRVSRPTRVDQVSLSSGRLTDIGGVADAERSSRTWSDETIRSNTSVQEDSWFEGDDGSEDSQSSSQSSSGFERSSAVYESRRSGRWSENR